MKNHIPRFCGILCVCTLLFTQLIGCDTLRGKSTAESNISTIQYQQSASFTYPIVGTGTTVFYSDTAIIDAPADGEAFYGQDANYQTNMPSYTDNGDGTITDDVTGLMWQQTMDEKIAFDASSTAADAYTLGGYDDWRVPTIKELYSLIRFTGTSGGEKAGDQRFIDTDYFVQPIGDTSKGEREIDAQTWSSTEYVGTTMNNDPTVFGVNFIDGRIKGYAKYSPVSGEPNVMYVRFVRGNTDDGLNDFVDNGNGTITDLATGLVWQTNDSGKGMDWQDALGYANNLELADRDDWRLPNAKELQSIVDYSRSPQTTNSAAINPLFQVSTIMDLDGQKNYPYFWTSTTHLDGINPYSAAVYIAFGKAQGIMNNRLMDVHGAGSQRSDPKSGDAADYPVSMGPQGDIRYVYNYVRCVTNIAPS